MNKEYLLHPHLYFAAALIIFLSVSSALPPAAAYASGSSQVKSIKWEGLASAIKKNKLHKKFFLLHFYYSTCAYCIRMNNHVFNHKSVINYINKHFHPVSVDIYSNKKILYFNGSYLTAKQLTSKFNVTGVPHDIFFSPDYKKIFVLPGYWNAKDFLLVAKWIGSGKYKVETLRKFARRS